MKYLTLILIFLFSATPISAATVTKTIGTSSRDYSTITLWEADLDDDPTYDAGDDAVGEIYNDSVFDEEPTINGGGTIGLNSITLTVASGNRHTGTAGTGARNVISAAGSGAILVLSAAPTTTVRWLELDGNNLARSGAKMGISVNQASGSIIDKAIIHGVTSIAATAQGMNLIEDAEVLRTIMYDMHVTTADAASDVARGFNMGASTKVQTLSNVTIFDLTADGNASLAEGISVADNATKKYQNVLVLDPNGTGSGADICWTDTSITTATSNNNGASDTSASGTAPQDSLTPATELVSTVEGSEDLHLKSGATSIDNGIDLNTTPTGVNLDIDNYDVDAAAVTWDIGADEFIAAVAAAAGMFEDIIFFYSDDI